MKRSLRAIPLYGLLLFSFPILATGCGGDSKASTVSGKVIFNGAPVTGGNLKFYPENSNEFTAGQINPDGTFSCGGIPTGKLKVVVDTESIKNLAANDYTKKGKMPDGAAPKTASGPTPTYVRIPIKYTKLETTDLTCEVKGGTNTFTFELKE